MAVAKGQRQPDGTYIYTCGTCGGHGTVHGQRCPFCYGLDTDKILEAMRLGARGERYYALLKAFLSVRGKDIVDTFYFLKSKYEWLTPVDLGYISQTYGLNFKATVEWLQENGCIGGGAYRSMSKLKVADIMAAANEKYGDT